MAGFIFLSEPPDAVFRLLMVSPLGSSVCGHKALPIKAILIQNLKQIFCDEEDKWLNVEIQGQLNLIFLNCTKL